MKRRQFPVRLPFAMTIDKAQGQTFKKVGIYLPRPVFKHGQLYVALPRAGSPKDVSVFITNTIEQRASEEAPHASDTNSIDTAGHCMNTPEGTFTRNIVYREVFTFYQVFRKRKSSVPNGLPSQYYVHLFCVAFCLLHLLYFLRWVIQQPAWKVSLRKCTIGLLVCFIVFWITEQSAWKVSLR